MAFVLHFNHRDKGHRRLGHGYMGLGWDGMGLVRHSLFNAYRDTFFLIIFGLLGPGLANIQGVRKGAKREGSVEHRCCVLGRHLSSVSRMISFMAVENEFYAVHDDA